VSEIGNNWPRRTLVGRIFQAIFHKNNLSLSFKFNFQMDFQLREETELEEVLEAAAVIRL
jgi:hypothetical protein